MPISRRHALQAGSGLISLMPTFGWANVPKRYHSDYFSFVGSDRLGSVYLAHDNNRGQTGDAFFADHWVMMYAEGQGVVPIIGSAHYPILARSLRPSRTRSISSSAVLRPRVSEFAVRQTRSTFG